LRSLERVQILIELECRLGIGIDETVLAGPSRVADLTSAASPPSPAPFPTWSLQWWARAIRKATLAPVLLPLTRCFVRLTVSGREHLQDLSGPVLFAPNHQSHLDTLAFLAALPSRWRHRTAAAAWKEYFGAHFYPAGHSFSDRLATSLAYYLVALLVNGFPLPQTEASTADSLRYIGDLVSEGWSILFYPEGGRADTPELMKFEPGIGLLASRLAIPVVPVRLRGVNEVLDRYARFPTPGPVTIAFGPPLRLHGDNFEALAAQVKEAVARL
jgi:long-chain acyl-CoA synthetase